MTAQEIYMKWRQHPKMEKSMQEELANLSAEEIEERFGENLTFGTAGLRGLMGAGTNRINRYTVSRATAGFAAYLAKKEKDANGRGVAIAYDTRRQSRTFAEVAAGVLAAKGFTVYLYPEVRPTPMLSFAVRHLQTAGGIMITASHNPPEYNGYKVYGADGGQLLEQSAKAIMAEMTQIVDELDIATISLDDAVEIGLVRWIDEEIEQSYYRQVLSLLEQPRLVKENGKDLCIVFTPFHGTGWTPVRKVLEQAGFPAIYPVEEQIVPDGDFPTVSVPNPEETRAFALAVEVARKYEADLVIGTDPDADRLGVLVKHGTQYIPLTGNQLGALLLSYLLEQKKEKGVLPNNGFICKSIVTSELGTKIANNYGVESKNLLTGFKYIAEQIKLANRKNSHCFLFGYEESYGSLIGDFVRDKDAVQATLLTAEMALVEKQAGRTLLNTLHFLYSVHGVHLEEVDSHTIPGRAGTKKMQTLMDQLRQQPPTLISKQKVVAVEDYLPGYHGLPPANVLRFCLSDDSWIAIRPSGTEPKIKFYYAAVGTKLVETRQKLERMKEATGELLKTAFLPAEIY